jgi:hypothetical protein
MSSEFPLPEIETEFGRQPVPKIVLPVRTPRGHELLEFLIDSGASFTMLPRPYAEVLGVDLGGAREIVARGIGGTGVSARLSEITLTVGNTELTIPCLFSSREDNPLLLGRMGFFSRFNVTFDNRRKKIVLEEI